MNDQGPRSDFANSPLGVHLTLSLEAAWVLVPSSQAGIVGPEIDWENEVARKTFPAPPDAAPRPGHDPAPSHWLELWHVDDQADVLRAWQRVADTGQHEDTGQSIDASARVRIRAAEPRTDVHSRSDWELTFTTIASGQVVAVAITWAFSIVATYVLLKLIDGAIGLRVSREQEMRGLDISQHGEEGYIMM